MRLRAVYLPSWECLECGRRFEYFPDVANGEFCCGIPGSRVSRLDQEHD